ncbi:asparagine synthase (glutamine-hydrolyzing) [Nonomuraea sp. NBC_01738]|uniref:asparagine synthase (glutamine-hydrolyzing) n=1 Tax=Nonomuraea sp. NBC_01738 TaxID=2976003 RepID=UPI002E13C3D7|nr:asparagine synthase (glutamine-hydrolyzing) [Nonomuraea sp. NBC_01738]
MCGIGGLLGADPTWAPPSSLVGEISRRLRHRGPDETHCVDVEAGSLISCRLAIMDPAGSRQPLSGCDDLTTVIYSGEIYNFRELRDELRAAGHVLHTEGDGEVIPHLYEMYGIDFPKRLRGAFAIAVHDGRTDQLILARDRLGEKPLVYAVTAHAFLFASEIKAILPFAAGNLSYPAVHQYLHFGYVLEPGTMFENIKKVPAGTVLVVDRKISLTPRATQYWSLEADGGERTDSMAEAFSTAVHQQLQADVPTAVALSDGIDSTLIALSAARHTSKSRAYSVAFGWMTAETQTEAPASTARRAGLLHEVVTLSPDRYLTLLTAGAEGLSEPIADWTMPAYLGMVQRCREDGVRVLLTGHGPDELFLAYDWTRSALAALTGKSNASCPSLRDAYLFNPEYRAAGEFFAGMRGDVLPGLDSDAVMAPMVRSGENARSDLRRQLASGYLRSNGLMQLDSLGLMMEVEVRLPYVDHRFVEAATRADTQNSRGEDNPKTLLYEMAARMGLATSFTPKRPFFPETEILRWPILELSKSSILDGLLVKYGIVTRRAAEQLIHSAEHPGAEMTVVYRLLLLELWLRSLATPAETDLGGIRR